ncbi:MAG: GNAT family N-acetyltransferase [Ardenticatenaceae bacterium]|nr:GNAT family N-acetyltransferase [Ardenticatenaceae bacterium]
MSGAIFDFTLFPTLTTERLVLRQVGHSDAADVLVSFGDFEVQKYNGPVLDLDGVHDLIANEIRAGYENKESLVWGITRGGEDRVMGMIGLWRWSRRNRRVILGYDLARVYWGKGYATEGITAVLNFAFTQMNLNRVEAYTIADNHRSVRLLERLGFMREGTRRNHSWEDDGTFHDSAIYGLLSGDWEMGNERLETERAKKQ